MHRTLEFPAGFLWGAATSAYQIEGGHDADGKGPSIWDSFTRRPGAVLAGETGDVACDHYHRWKEDVALIKALGLNSYRFSIAWPRVIPQGTGAVNAKGLDFYDRLVDGLLAAGIEPNATLYHWDLPQALEERGGWQNREVVKWFADYASVCGRRLGDRVRLWSTHNEPWCTYYFGYGIGVFAPGLKLDQAAQHRIIHHLLMSHHSGALALRAACPKPPKVGLVYNLSPAWPASGDPRDVEAAFRVWTHENDWWVLPLTEGRYPADGLARRGAAAPAWTPDDFNAGPPDWIGLNYYFPVRFAAGDPVGPAQEAFPAPELAPDLQARMVGAPAGAVTNDQGWESNPGCLESLLTTFTRRYGKWPIYITENGFSTFGVHPGPDGHVHDQRRLEYFKAHLHALRNSLDRGVDLRGFYAWSLLDNFEWNSGYKPQFGIVHVDFKTQARTPKDSALWYAAAARAGAFEDEARCFDADPFAGLRAERA